MTYLIKRNWPEGVFPKLFEDLENFFDSPPLFCCPEEDDAKIDIKEHDDKVEVIADIPGFKKEDIEIKYERGYLTISGEVKKEKEKEDEEVKYLHKEIKNRSFARRFQMGDSFDSTKIDAKYEDGILTILLPKSEKEKFRKIDIK